MSGIVVNGAFRDQRITGQQRYATEVADRLLTNPDVEELRPAPFWTHSTLLIWVWVQLVLPLLAGDRVLISMTSRAPVWRRRTVLIVHDTFVLDNPEWYSRRYSWTHAPLLRLQLRSARGVIAVSEPIAHKLRSYCAKPVAVAPNAPSEEFSTKGRTGSKDDAIKEWKLESDSYLLAVGSRDPRKNLPRLLNAYDQLTKAERLEFPLVLVGGGSSIFRGETTQLPFGVIEAGYVPDRELKQLYAHARCVVMLSLAEGFGLPIVEAANSGARGLLVSDIEVFRWLCANNVRYADPLSEEDILRGLRQELRSAQDMKFDTAGYTWERSADTVCRTAERVARLD